MSPIPDDSHPLMTPIPNRADASPGLAGPVRGAARSLSKLLGRDALSKAVPRDSSQVCPAVLSNTAPPQPFSQHTAGGAVSLCAVAW